MKAIYKSSVGCPLFYSNLSDGVKSFMGTGPAASACNYADEITVRDVIAEALQPFPGDRRFLSPCKTNSWFSLRKNNQPNFKNTLKKVIKTTLFGDFL